MKHLEPWIISAGATLLLIAFSAEWGADRDQSKQFMQTKSFTAVCGERSGSAQLVGTKSGKRFFAVSKFLASEDDSIVVGDGIRCTFFDTTEETDISIFLEN